MLMTLRGGAAVTGEVARLRPDVVVVDLPKAKGGLRLIEVLMAVTPTPIVCCGASAEYATEALAAGVVAVVDPTSAAQGWAQILRSAVAASHGAAVIRHPRGRLAAQMQEPAPVRGVRTAPRLVALGASTGGPPALAAILAGLPAELPLPILVVQHMANGFISGLAQWLDAVTPLRVAVAGDGERLRSGQVSLAPSERNLMVQQGLTVALRDPPPGQFHVPSIDRALASVAEVCGAQAVGVLLTGMGSDGAQGLAAMRRAGATTIAQDEASSVVFGMPSAACDAGAVGEVVALPDVAAAILRACAVPTPTGQSGGW